MKQQFSPAPKRNAFTLIELLVVIAIIAILAAILFPVFGRAREMARRSSCLNNLKQIGTGMLQYSQDFDETVVPYRVGGTPGDNPFTGQPGVGGPQTSRYKFYPVLLQPYIKNYDVFKCPSNKRPWVNTDPDPNSDTATDFLGYGGQNSYGVSNYTFQSNTGIKLSLIVESANTIGAVDARYYNVLPKTPNSPATIDTASGTPVARAAGETCVLQGKPDGRVTNDNALYWKNIGGSYLFNMVGGPAGTEVRPTDAEATERGQLLHMGMINTLFMDGHAKALRWDKVAIDTELKAGSTTSMWDPYKLGCRVP